MYISFYLNCNNYKDNCSDHFLLNNNWFVCMCCHKAWLLCSGVLRVDLFDGSTADVDVMIKGCWLPELQEAVGSSFNHSHSCHSTQFIIFMYICCWHSFKSISFSCKVLYRLGCIFWHCSINTIQISCCLVTNVLCIINLNTTVHQVRL